MKTNSADGDHEALAQQQQLLPDNDIDKNGNSVAKTGANGFYAVEMKLQNKAAFIAAYPGATAANETYLCSRTPSRFCDIALHSLHMSIWSPFSGAVFGLKNGQKTAELLSPAPGFAITSQKCPPSPDGSIGTKFSEAPETGEGQGTYKRHRGMQSRLQNSACAGS